MQKILHNRYVKCNFAEYRKKYKPELAIKVSLRPFHKEESLLHLPLYLLFTLSSGIKE